MTWRERNRAAVAILLGSCVLLGCGGGEASPDAAVALDGGLCNPDVDRVCDANAVYFVDSCGTLGDQFRECTEERACNDDFGNCCLPVATTGSFMDTPVFSETYFQSTGASSEVTLDLELTAFSTGGQAQAIRYAVQIDDTDVLFGLRADLADTGPSVGPGIDFVAYIGSEDVDNNAEPFSPSYSNSGPDGGGFVRINRPTDLGPRSIASLRITREEEQGGADWFSIYVALDGGAEEQMGRLLVPRAGGSPATFAGGEHRLYSGVLRAGPFTTADVGKVQAWVSTPTYDGEPATGARLEYPLLPPDDAPFPNADVTYDPISERIQITQGGVSAKCSEAGDLF